MLDSSDFLTLCVWLEVFSTNKIEEFFQHKINILSCECNADDDFVIC